MADARYVNIKQQKYILKTNFQLFKLSQTNVKFREENE